MAQPVKISDGLMIEARTAGELMQRSIAGQVEFWARLGMAVGGLLTARQMRVVGAVAGREAVLERLDTVDTEEARERVKQYLAGQPFPHSSAHPVKKGLLIRVDESSRKDVGRCVNRECVIEKQARKSTAA